MDEESRTFERNSEFARAYNLIGRLELHLRYQIPITLSSYAEERGHREWHEVVPLNEYAQNSLNRANKAVLMAKQEKSTASTFLPFSFWRYLLSNRNYGDLWLPNLHVIFPGLENPKTRSAFRQVDLHMNSALRLRHNVAHYNLNCLGTIAFSQKKVEWLLDSLGVTTNQSCKTPIQCK